mgnify:CR=1 FL=1
MVLFAGFEAVVAFFRLDRLSLLWEASQQCKCIGFFFVKAFLTIPIFLVFFLAACGDVMGDLSDRDLRHRHYECQVATRSSAAELQVCANVKRECDRRAKSGHYAC